MIRRGTYITTVLVLLLAELCLGYSCLHAQTSERLADSVQPFVDRQELAGAVMLVADKDQVLAAEAVGWGDIAAQKPMQTFGSRRSPNRSQPRR